MFPGNRKERQVEYSDIHIGRCKAGFQAADRALSSMRKQAANAHTSAFKLRTEHPFIAKKIISFRFWPVNSSLRTNNPTCFCAYPINPFGATRILFLVHFSNFHPSAHLLKSNNSPNHFTPLARTQAVFNPGIRWSEYKAEYNSALPASRRLPDSGTSAWLPARRRIPASAQ